MIRGLLSPLPMDQATRNPFHIFQDTSYCLSPDGNLIAIISVMFNRS